MSQVSAALALYADAARDTARAFPRTAWALLALFLATPILHLVGAARGVAAAGTGFGGGIVAGLVAAVVHAIVVGWYLGLLEIGVLGRRRIHPRDLGSTVGRHWGAVISVLFVFWIASLVLGMTVPLVVPIAALVATVLFNPVPELIYQRGGESLAVLGDAARFMQSNWPEWLGAHLAAALGLLLFGVALGGVGWGLTASLVGTFGPFFGFVTVGSLALAVAGAGLQGILLGAGVLVFSHAFLLFRGFLFQRLATSSRRGRAWQQQLR